MNNQIDIYFDPESNQYYYCEKEVLKCDKCKENIENIMILSLSWMRQKSTNTTHSSIKCFCINCMGNIREYGSINETKPVNITNIKPITAYRYVFAPPDTGTCGNKTVFSEAMRSSDGEEIINNTVLAGKIDYEHKEQVEQRIANRELEHTDANVQNADEFDDLMLDMKKSTPYQEEKQLSALEIQNQLLDKRIEDKSKKDGKN